MATAQADWTKAMDALNEIRQELGRLAERVSALETAGGRTDALSARSPAPAPAAVPAPAPAALDEELIAVISSAIAAFLGKKPHIRQIRLIRSGAWAEQGRVTIQASHALSAHTARSYP